MKLSSEAVLSLSLSSSCSLSASPCTSAIVSMNWRAALRNLSLCSRRRSFSWSAISCAHAASSSSELESILLSDRGWCFDDPATGWNPLGLARLGSTGVSWIGRERAANVGSLRASFWLAAEWLRFRPAQLQVVAKETPASLILVRFRLPPAQCDRCFRPMRPGESELFRPPHHVTRHWPGSLGARWHHPCAQPIPAGPPPHVPLGRCCAVKFAVRVAIRYCSRPRTPNLTSSHPFQVPPASVAPACFYAYSAGLCSCRSIRAVGGHWQRVRCPHRFDRIW